MWEWTRVGTTKMRVTNVAAAKPRIVGIVNLTEDSFSDGGRYLECERALDQAHRLIDEGADIVELGPASSHPDSRDVPAPEEIRRLAPVVAQLVGKGVAVAVDSFAPETQLWCLDQGVSYLNDIQAFPDARVQQALAHSSCRLIAMHSVQGRGRATRVRVDAEAIMPRIEARHSRIVEVRFTSSTFCQSSSDIRMKI